MSQNKERNIKSTQNFTKMTKDLQMDPKLNILTIFSKMSEIVLKNEITNQNFTYATLKWSN